MRAPIVHSSRRFLISLGAGTLVGIVLPAVVFAIGWTIDRVRGEDLAAEALGLLLLTPILGASMGISFWLVRFPLAERLLGDLSDVYPQGGAMRSKGDSPRQRLVVRWLLFWVILGAAFGALTVILFGVVVGIALLSVHATAVTLESASSQGVLSAIQETLLHIGPVLFQEVQNVPIFSLIEPVLLGAFFGWFFWALLLLFLRHRPQPR